MVRLTGGDLRRLMEHLGVASVFDLRTKGLVSLVREPVGGDRFAWRPRLRFRSRPLRQCPFLVNDVTDEGYRGLCSLHPHFKPLVCALSPLAREVVDPGSGPVDETWTAVAPVEGCPGMGRGEVLEVGPPRELAPRLSEEVTWLRTLIALSPFCPDEESAWAALARSL